MHFIPKASSYSQISQAEKQDLVEEMMLLLQENYINKSAIILKAELLKEGLLQSLDKLHATKEDLAKDLTAVLQRIIDDKHLGIRPKNNASPDEHNRNRQTWMESVNYGFEKVQVENNNIGYLKLSHFVWPRGFPLAQHSGIKLKKSIREAFTQLNTAKALIIDLRGNEGGSPEMVAAIASFLLQPGILLNEFIGVIRGALCMSTLAIGNALSTVFLMLSKRRKMVLPSRNLKLLIQKLFLTSSLS
jgi:hypothetical protein